MVPRRGPLRLRRRLLGAPVWLLFALVPIAGACRDDTSEVVQIVQDPIRVLEVQDGDSLRLDVGAVEVKVRLVGIDAPEKNQAHGDEARAALAELVAEGPLRLVQDGTDRYGRLLVQVFIANDPISVNQHLVDGGHAWHYLRYSEDAGLATAEREARAGRRGLWADAAPTPPWEFRAKKRGLSSDAVAPVPAPSLLGDGAPAVIGNSRSRKYHLAACPGYRATAPSNSVPFEDAEAAEAAGFTRAGNCP